MMKLKVQQIFDATQVLAALINEKRALPTKGVYRISRMHAKLFPEFTLINEQRSAKIASYDHTALVLGGAIVPETDENLQNPLAQKQPAVPADKMPEFVAWWNEMAAVEIDVNIDPIPVGQLCADGQSAAITYAEFGALGELIRDD